MRVTAGHLRDLDDIMKRYKAETLEIEVPDYKYVDQSHQTKLHLIQLAAEKLNHTKRTMDITSAEKYCDSHRLALARFPKESYFMPTSCFDLFQSMENYLDSRKTIQEDLGMLWHEEAKPWTTPTWLDRVLAWDVMRQ
ncbi:hypothetical protein C8035_v004545 [Colletotrichum spinosum]|uniref:Uncharacterized protein n=1 Tax=Colletotrichum spinosum TaxID=1347390 RepID=A0A4V6QEB4_9PEZI|nr:hypothetical protein C8035_v004545 [Colletotrichum spinosum]